MARIVALDELDPKLKSVISGSLRVCDEAVVLPQAHKSPESGALKNVVMRLDGGVDGLDPEVFNSNWFAGVSVIEFPVEKAEIILSSEARRVEAMRKLKEAITSEMFDTQIQVGPELDGGEQDRDNGKWECGFDSAGCCVGLYSAVQSKQPDSHLSGMSRAHKSYFLVCKAGAGIAGQTFHARLTASLKSGKTLDEALGEEGTPGARALRRVAAAGRRNRCRILNTAAQTLAYHSCDTIGDNMSPTASPYRVVIPAVDVTYNALVSCEGLGERNIWQYTSGCVEQSLSLGTLASSNVAEGFIMFTQQYGEVRYTTRNDAYNATPFATTRVLSNREVVFKATDEHSRAAKSRAPAHPDDAWLKSHFAWNSKTFVDGQADIEPGALWGSHESERFIGDWARELGLSKASAVRLNPEAVVLAAVEPGKLRVAAKAVQRAASS